MGSSTRAEIDLGAVTLAKLAHAYHVPTVLTTVAVGMGVNKPTVDEIAQGNCPGSPRSTSPA